MRRLTSPHMLCRPRQYQPQHLVNKGETRSRGGWTKYSEIGARTPSADVAELLSHARQIGLWRFEEAAGWEGGDLAG